MNSDFWSLKANEQTFKKKLCSIQIWIWNSNVNSMNEALHSPALLKRLIVF